MKEYVWYYKPYGCFVIAPYKNYPRRSMRWLDFLTDKPEPALICAKDFEHWGEL